MIGKILLTISVTDIEKFNHKDKPVLYSRAFIELHYWRNHRLMHEIYRMVEVEKYFVSRVENSQKLDTYRFYEIPSILCSIHIMP